MNAKADGLDMDCVKLWCGQVGEIDPLRYDKFYKDEAYIRSQYLIAEKHLNIITNPTPQTKNNQEVKTLQDQVTKQQKQLEQLQGQFETILKGKVAVE